MKRVDTKVLAVLPLWLLVVLLGCGPRPTIPMPGSTAAAGEAVARQAEAPSDTPATEGVPTRPLAQATLARAATRPPEPSSTPSLPASPTVEPSTPFARTRAWLADLRGAYPAEQQVAELVEALSADTIAYLEGAVDPEQPLAEQEGALNRLAADLPGGAPGAPGPEESRVVPADLDAQAQVELFVVPALNPAPILYVRHTGEQWETVPVPVPSPETGQDVAAAPNLWPASLEIRDVTGDGRPEALATHITSGASSIVEHFQVLRWESDRFEVLFRAGLVNWAGESTWALEPGAAGAQDVVLRYPDFYWTGFEHKMVYHPQGMQRWQWDDAAARFTLAETRHDPESVLAAGEHVPAWEMLRVLVNEAEMRYQEADLEGALARYQDVIARAQSEEMQRPAEMAPNWPAYARFRVAQVRALQGSGEAAEEEMNTLLADLDETSNLRPMVQAFVAAYDPHRPDAAFRASAALQGSGLYQLFYEDRPGDLDFPMNAATILWPGTPMAVYLEAHPEMLGQDAALQQALAGLGFPVVDVQSVDLNDDGTLEVLVTVDETAQVNGLRITWLLAAAEGWRSFRLGEYGPITQAPLSGGRIALQSGGSALAWNGQALIKVDPATGEALPPAWPTVGGF